MEGSQTAGKTTDSGTGQLRGGESARQEGTTNDTNSEDDINTTNLRTKQLMTKRERE